MVNFPGLQSEFFKRVDYSTVDIHTGECTNRGAKTFLDAAMEARETVLKAAGTGFFCSISDAFDYARLIEDLKNVDNLDDDNPLKRYGLRLFGDAERTNEGVYFLLLPVNKMDVWSYGSHIGKLSDDDRDMVFQSELQKAYRIEIHSYSFLSEEDLRHQGLEGYQIAPEI